MDDAAEPRSDTAPTRMREWLTLSFSIFLVALVAGSTPRAVGDGGEYLVMALNMAEVGTPWLTDADLARRRAETSAIAGLESWDIVSSTKTSRLGTRDFLHFWLYPALAQPFVAIARAIGANPTFGFAVLNLTLLVGAFWLALPRLGNWLTWLLFASPVIWWIDKPHTEVFTFSLLVIAMLLIEDAPVWAVVAAGAAAAQNPPILAMVPFAAVALGSRGAEHLRRPAVWIGLLGGLALGGLAVIYTQFRHGTPSLLFSATLHAVPSLRAMLVVPFDSNLGLVAAFPAFVAITLLAVGVLAFTPKRLAAPGIVLALLTLPVFLISFAQTGNMHHGGTPGMSRYALWLVPLGIPLLRELHGVANRWMKRAVALIAVPSAIASTFIFHPKHADNYREPTWLAQTLWTRYPSLTNPLPEIFVDVLAPGGGEQLPLAVPGCAKVLLIGRGDDQGMWPVPCYPAEVPADCRRPAALCYANLRGSQYAFRPIEDVQHARFKFDPGRVWRRSAEATVRRVMDRLDWRTLQPGSSVRQATAIDSTHDLEGRDRLLVAMVGTRDGARLSLRLPQAMSGAFVDPETADEVPVPASNSTPGDLWPLAVPPNHEVLLLVLRVRK